MRPEGDPLPLLIPFPTPSRTDLVTVRVLRTCLLPGEPEASARELVELADRAPSPLRQALSRLDRAHQQQPSAVLARARALLHAALALVEESVPTQVA